MKGGTIIGLFYEVGITPSVLRPRVSNDNPYIESLNRTMKRRIDYPRSITDIAHAWMADFVHRYNTELLHSAIGYVTPEQRRRGDDRAISAGRNGVIRTTFEYRPERWARGPSYYAYQKAVVLNPTE